MRPTREGRVAPGRPGLVFRGIGVDPTVETEDPPDPVDRASAAEGGEAFIPFTAPPGTLPAIVHSYQGLTTGGGSFWGWTGTSGNVLLQWVFRRAGTDFSTPSGWTLLEDTYDSNPECDRIKAFAKISNGTETQTSLGFGADFIVVELSGVDLSDIESNQNSGTTTSVTTGSVTPTAGQPAIIFGAHALFGDNLGGPRTSTPGAGYTELYDADTDNNPTGAPHCAVYYQIDSSTSGSYNPAATASSIGGPCTTKWSGVTVSLIAPAGGGTSWIPGPLTIDDDDVTAEQVFEDTITATTGPFWRGTLANSYLIASITAEIAFESAGSVTLLVQAGNEADYSDAATIDTITTTATGSYTPDTIVASWSPVAVYQYWQIVLDTAVQDIYVHEVSLFSPVAGAVSVAGVVFAIQFVFDAGTSALSGNPTMETIVPANGTIVSATMLADASGSAVVDVFKSSYSGYAGSLASIVASAKPTLSSAIKSQDTTLTGWTTALTAGDVLRARLDSSSTVKHVVLVLMYTRD